LDGIDKHQDMGENILWNFHVTDPHGCDSKSMNQDSTELSSEKKKTRKKYRGRV
jgi:hypothetical protein